MIYYLKANRNNSYVIPNVKHWLDAAMLDEEAVIYILCDNDVLKEKIKTEILSDYDKVEFLQSDRDCEEINKILNNVCASPKWIKVGQAHLKTHWHADEMGYDCFWNIDADDTFVCLDPIRVFEMLKCVQDYSLSKGVAMNSLDMWRSMANHEKWTKGIIWSLGITFVDNRIDWKKNLLEHCTDKKLLDGILPIDMDANLDWYFTYLKDINVQKIETFYFENLKFLHFYDYFINFPHLSSFSHWKDGILRYPIIEHCFASNARKNMNIAEDILKFDIGIKDDESLISLISCSEEIFSFMEDINNIELDIGHVMLKRCEYMLNKMKKKRMVCWGAGRCFYRYEKMIRKAYDLEYVCDNDSKKWGMELVDGVKCISPNELEKMKKDVFVLLLMDNPAVNHKIIHQLLDMGITSFDHYSNWIMEVEGVVL